jgi:hypothetical protein
VGISEVPVDGVPSDVGNAFVVTVRGDVAMNGQPLLAASGQICVAANTLVV